MKTPYRLEDEVSIALNEKESINVWALHEYAGQIVTVDQLTVDFVSSVSFHGLCQLADVEDFSKLDNRALWFRHLNFAFQCKLNLLSESEKDLIHPRLRYAISYGLHCPLDSDIILEYEYCIHESNEKPGRIRYNHEISVIPVGVFSHRSFIAWSLKTSKRHETSHFFGSEHLMQSVYRSRQLAYEEDTSSVIDERVLGSIEPPAASLYEHSIESKSEADTEVAELIIRKSQCLALDTAGLRLSDKLIESTKHSERYFFNSTEMRYESNRYHESQYKPDLKRAHGDQSTYDKNDETKKISKAEKMLLELRLESEMIIIGLTGDQNLVDAYQLYACSHVVLKFSCEIRLFDVLLQNWENCNNLFSLNQRRISVLFKPKFIFDKHIEGRNDGVHFENIPVRNAVVRKIPQLEQLTLCNLLLDERDTVVLKKFSNMNKQSLTYFRISNLAVKQNVKSCIAYLESIDTGAIKQLQLHFINANYINRQSFFKSNIRLEALSFHNMYEIEPLFVKNEFLPQSPSLKFLQITGLRNESIVNNILQFIPTIRSLRFVHISTIADVMAFNEDSSILDHVVQKMRPMNCEMVLSWISNAETSMNNMPNRFILINITKNMERLIKHMHNARIRGLYGIE
ncbi:hypothetical protein ACOME3_005298 [Neoechinorhynchus agilis]